MKGNVTLGLAGFGTVGTGLAQILEKNGEWIKRRTGCEFTVRTVLVRDLTRQRSWPLPAGAALTDSLDDLLAPEIDIVVELMGGTDAAKSLIEQALIAGKHVVTANKALLAEHGPELFKLAADNNVGLYYESSVAGAIPIVQSLKENLAANRVTQLMGILNGTANFILSEMTTEGLDFDTALTEAQTLGYAEADPTFDIEGIDAAHKLILLIRLAFGSHYPLEKLPVQGISNVSKIDIEFAREFGYRIKLIGQAREVDGKIEAGIFPALIKYTYLIARVGHSFNAVRVECDMAGPVMLYGRGAGDTPTGSAVMADIMALARGGNINSTGFIDDELPPAEILDSSEAVAEHYLRFTVTDRPRVMATLSRIMADHNVSIRQAIQRGEAHDKEVPIVFTTHSAKVDDVAAAVREVDECDFIKAPTVTYRIL